MIATLLTWAICSSLIIVFGFICVLLTPARKVEWRMWTLRATVLGVLLTFVNPPVPEAAAVQIGRTMSGASSLNAFLSDAETNTIQSRVPEAIQSQMSPEVRHYFSPAVFVIWVNRLGLFLLAFTLAAAYLRVWALRHHSTRQEFKDLDFSVGYEVRVMNRPVKNLALAIGLVRPCILVSQEFLRLSPELRQDILQHEEAHLRNCDLWWQLTAECLRVILWWNPLVHVLARVLRQESEKVADHFVLQRGTSAGDYARHLIDLAHGLAGRTPRAGIAFIRREGLKGRIRAILSDSGGKTAMRTTQKLVVIAVAAALGIGVALAKQARNTQSPIYKDSVAATADNGFRGKFSNGSEFEILQVSRKIGDKIIAWKPNGDPIKSSEVIKHGYSKQTDEHTRYFLYRVKRNPKDVASMNVPGSKEEPACYFGSYIATNVQRRSGEPNSLSFSGGWLVSQDKEYATFICLIGVPKEDGDRISFGITYSDGARTRKPLDKTNPAIKDVSCEPITVENVKRNFITVKDKQIVPAGLILKWAEYFDRSSEEVPLIKVMNTKTKDVKMVTLEDMPDRKGEMSYEPGTGKLIFKAENLIPGENLVVLELWKAGRPSYDSSLIDVALKPKTGA